MNIEEFRKYCLSLPGATEKMPWSDPRYASLIVFSVGEKWFGLVDIDAFDYCNLKCDPEKSDELRARYDGIMPGWHMNKRHWISVYFHSDVPERLIKQLVSESYHTVFSSLSKKEQQRILAEES